MTNANAAVQTLSIALSTAASNGAANARGSDAPQQQSDQAEVRRAVQDPHVSAFTDRSAVRFSPLLHDNSIPQESRRAVAPPDSKSAGLQRPAAAGSANKAVNEPKKKQPESKAVPAPQASAAKFRQNAKSKRQQTFFN